MSFNYRNVSLVTASSEKYALRGYIKEMQWWLFLYTRSTENKVYFAPISSSHHKLHIASLIFNYTANASFLGTYPKGDHWQSYSKVHFTGLSVRSPRREGVETHQLSFHLFHRPSWTTPQSSTLLSLSEQDSEVRTGFLIVIFGQYDHSETSTVTS